MHSIQEIIVNQEKFKEKILNYFLKEYSNAKKELNKIKSSDNFIQKEKNKLAKKFKKIKPQPFVEKFFFMHSKRNKNFYVWWDEENEEVKILKYGKK